MSLRSDQREDGESTSGSSEAKTDRYGFLLVNGDTNNDSSDDLCPELVRHREKKWVTLMCQWDQVLGKKHSKIKAQCQKGIPASVRSRCWPLLCGAIQRQKNNEGLYKTLESSPGQQSWIDVIKRDTDRQFPFHEMFQSEDSHGQQGLLQVLKAYTEFRPDEGYCQAQGPVAAVLLMNMPMEEAFWCLVQISELYLPGYYSPLLEGVLFDAAILFAVLKRTCPAAYKHMQRQGVEPLMFATDWLMCLYSRHLPFNTLLRVWDLFFCNGVRVLFQVAVVLVRRCLGEAKHRKECEGQMETLERLRSVRGHVQHEQADAFIQEVCSVPLSVAELQRQTEKELEKWRNERPGSTFDPRDRCHGYHMIWEKAKEKEKENEKKEEKENEKKEEKENKKKEKQSGHLSASLMRSHSSLSPAILRKKLRKRGSKAETEEWEGRGLSKQDSDDDEKRRASVCGVAGELRAKTQKTPQEFSTHLQKDSNTITNTQGISATETKLSSNRNKAESSDHSATVFEEDENVVAVITIPSHKDSDEHEEEQKPPSSLKDDDLLTGNSQQEIEKQHGTETRQDEEMKVWTPGDDQDEVISTHQDQPEVETQQDQPEVETQQEESQPSQLEEEEDARNKLEEETQENRSKQEEEIESKTCKPEEEVQLIIITHEEEVNITQQEVEVKVNTDTQEQEIHVCTCEQEQEDGINSKHEEELQMESIIQEEETGTNSQEQEEIHLSSTEEEAIYNNSKQEKEIKPNSSEREVEIQEEMEIKANSSEQEVETEEEKEIKANSSEREVETEEEKEIKANSSEREVETEEEKEIKANSSEREVETEEEKEIKANNSEREVETEEEKEIKANSSEREVETEEEKEIKANSSEREVETEEEKEIKANSSEQEVEIQEEKEMKANSSVQEVEIQDNDKQAKSDNEEEKLKTCLVHEEDLPKDEPQQQEASKQTNEVEESLEMEEETCSSVQTPDDQEDAEEQAHSVQEEDHVIGGSNTNEERSQQDQEGVREHSEEPVEEARISDAPGEETEGTVMDEEKRSCTVDQEESETSSPCIQLEMVMEHSGESETPLDSNQTQDENQEVNKISSPEHGKPDRISGSSNPEPPQPDNKEEEEEIETKITPESNPVKPATSGSHSHPQLRLRRSSSSHTPYPTILSEDTFRDPQQSIKRESCPQTPNAEESDITQPTKTQSSKPEDLQNPQTQTLQTQTKSDKPKRRGLFNRLRADTPSKSTIPKIVIQDFSEGEEKLSSKERRRRRRMQERKEKEEEKERKKLEKELEKEKQRERKKPQTRGKSFQVLSRKHDDDDVFSGRSGSQTVGRKRNSYSESYF